MNYLDYKKRDGFKGEKLIVIPTEAFADYVQHPLIKRLYLTDVGFFPKAKHHYRERKEGIEEYIFLYCISGQGTVEIGNTQITLSSCNAITIPAQISHCYYAESVDPWSVFWIHFKGEDVQYYPLETCEKVYFVTDFASERMMFLFDLLFRVLQANYTQGNFIYMSQVLQMILSETYFREKKNATVEQNKTITNIIRYMYENLEDAISLTDILNKFEISGSNLNKIFKQYTKHSPIDFYIRLKIRYACSLLKSSNMLVGEVAAKIGYQDPFYFSRIFKNIVGVSPKEYKTGEYFHYK